MSNRSERREAERLARKLAYQEQRLAQQRLAEAKQALADAGLFPQSEQSVSEAQLAANRANAKLSTGPVTAEGKTTSSMNALKNGLTGKTVLLPNEDAEAYQRELKNYIDIYQPANDEELRLVQSRHDCIWRLNRIQRLESGILLKGHLEFSSDEHAARFEGLTPNERDHLIQAEAYIKYEKQLRNLNIQESRLRRTMEKDRTELLRLQAQRRQQELAALQNPKQAPNGFEFSTAATATTTAPDPANDPAHEPHRQAA